LKRQQITKVTPQMIAYAALQVLPTICRVPDLIPSPLPQTYVGLSAMKQWDNADGTFNLIHLYHLIMKTISNNADRWVAETMDWWQR
jgi:hypothetical protein